MSEENKSEKVEENTEKNTITTADVVLVFRADGPGIALDREMLEKMARGVVTSLTAEDLSKRGIQSLSTKSFGWYQIDTAQATQQRISEVRAAGDAPPANVALPANVKPITNGKKKQKR